MIVSSLTVLCSAVSTPPNNFIEREILGEEVWRPAFL